MKRTTILFLSLLAVLACSRQAGTTTGSTPEVEARVDKLLSQMSLQEKIGQMNQISAGGDVAQYADALRAGQIGSILNEVV